MIENTKKIFGLSPRGEFFDLFYEDIGTHESVPMITSQKQLDDLYGKGSLRAGFQNYPSGARQIIHLKPQ